MTKIYNLKSRLGLCLSVLVICLSFSMKAQLSGVKTIPTDYPTLAATIADINLQGVNGALIVNIPAGFTETAPVGGFSLTATGTIANTITFQKSGAGANPLLTAYAGGVGTPTTAVQDGVFKLIGSDYITIDGIDINDPNAANPATMEYGYGLYKASASDGCQNNTIKNCVVTLNRINNAAGTSPMVDGSTGIIVMNATASAATTVLTATTTAGSNSNNKFYTNTIQNCNTGIALIGYAAATPFTAADFGNDIGGSSSTTGNTIINFGGGAAANAAAGIRTLAQYGINVSYNTINNNNGSGVNHASTIRGIYLNTAVSANASINSNTLTIKSGTTTSQVSIIENVSGATAATNTININNNLITNCTNALATTSTFYGIYNTASASALNVNGNTFTNNTTNATSGTTYLIYNSGAVASSINITNNSLGHSFVGAAAYTGTYYNIYNSSATVLTDVAINNNNFANINFTTVTGTGTIYFIYASSSPRTSSISNNTWSNLTLNHSGSEYLMYNLSSTQVSLIVDNNRIISAFNRTAAAGTMYCYYASASSLGTSTQQISNNTFAAITANTAGSGTFYGIQTAFDGGSSPYPKKMIYNNILSNVTYNSSGTLYGIYASYLGDGTSAVGSSIYNNTLASITFSGTVYGMYLSTTTSPTIKPKVYNNSIHDITSNGATSSLYGAYAGSGGAGLDFYKNKIYNIVENGATGSAHGIYIPSATTTNIFNNLVGAINTPSASGLTPVNGIYVGGGTTVNAYYNTVYLAATSTGTLFGNSAVYATTGTNLDLRNNIFVNLSAQTGTGTAVAYRRANTTLTSYLTTSNNNLLYAGTPTPKNLIFSDGTNDYITLPSYQTAMVNRDQSAVTENPTFLSTTGSSANFLHINPATITTIEGGAANIATFTDDYDGDIRQGNAGYAGTGSAPDIGADEFNGISPAPSINALSITPTGNKCVAVGRVVTATVTPGSVNLTSITLNYSFNGVAQPTIAMTGGSLSSASSWTGNIPVAVPSNANVAWYVSVTDGTYTKTSNGTSYKDEPLTGVVAQATASLSTICAGSPSTLTASFGNPTSAATSALPPAVSNPTTDEDLGNIIFGTLTNSTAINSLVGSIGTANGVAGSYSDFTAFGPYAFTAGTSYSLSLTSLQAATAYGNAFGVYIDYNRNGVFTDAGEAVYVSTVTTSGTHTETTSITIPATAKNGLTRMRVVVNEGLVTGPTMAVSWGEYEEYMLNISSANQGGGSVPTFTAYAWNDGTSSVATTSLATLSPTTTTTYSVIATDINGCSVISSPVTVSVVPIPSIPTVTNTAQCGVAASSSAVGGGTSYNWYSTNTSTLVLQSGATSTYTTPISSTSTFYVASDNGVCLSPRAAVTTSVSLPDPIMASASATAICPGNSVLLSSTQGTVNVYTFTWTATPAAGSGIPTSIAGNTVNVTPTASGTYVYQVYATDGICSTTSSVSVVLNNPPSITATANPNVICSTASVNLNATTPMVAAGTSTVGGGSLTTTSQPNPYYTTYWGNKNQYLIKASELTAAGYYAGNLTSLGIDLLGVTTTLQLTNFNISIGTSTLTAMPATWQTGLTTVYSNPSYSLVPNTINTHVFSTPFAWDGVSNIVIETCFNNAGWNGSQTIKYNNAGYVCSLSYQADAATVCSAPGAPTTSSNRPNLILGGQVVTQGAGGMVWQWNPGAINTNTAIVNPVNTGTTPVTQNYTVSATDPVTTCSNTAVVAVLINPLPTTPTAVNSTQCGLGIPTAAVSGGSSYNWYATPTSTIVLQAGTSATFTSSINSTTSWYVSSYNGTCESPRVILTATVNIPDAVTASTSNSVICIGQPVTLTATKIGSSNTYVYTWTGSPVSGSGIPSSVTGSTTLVTPTASGNYNYLVTAVDGICTTTASINVLVNSLPIVSASATPSVVCSSAAVNLAAASVSSGTSSIGTGTLTTTSQPNPYYTTYWGNKNQYLIKASELIAAGYYAGNLTSLGIDLLGVTTTLQLTNFNISIGTSTLTAMPATWQTGLTTVYSNPSYSLVPNTINTHVFSTPFAWDGVSNIVIETCFNNAGWNGSQTIRYTNPGFVSSISYQADASTVCSAPLAPTTSSNRPNLILGGQVVTQAASSLVWQWNPGAINTNTTIVNPTNTGTTAVTNVYTVSVTNPTTTCSNSTTVAVVVNPLPTTPIVANSIQCGLAVPTASVSGGTSYNWYATPTSTTALQTGTSDTYTTAINNTTNFYVSSYNGTCESVRAALTVTVNTPDNITASSSSSLACPGSSILLSSTQGSVNVYVFTWSATPSAGSGIPTTVAGNTVNVTPTTPGTYVYQVYGTDGICSTTSTVSVTLNTAPILLASASPTAVCSTGSVNLNAASVANGTNSIGTGTLTTTSQPNPYYTTYWGNKNQYLIKASELIAAGYYAGNLTSLGIDLLGVTTTLQLTNFNISIGTSTLTAMPATWQTGLTTVYSNPSYSLVPNTINTHVFSTPFAWDGVSNIVIETCFNNAGWNGSQTIRYTNPGFVSSISYQADISTVCSAPGTPVTSSNRPNLILGGLLVAQSAGSLAWQWNPGAINTNTAIVNPTNTGTTAVTQVYTVSVTNPTTTCVNTATVGVLVNPLPVAPTVANSTQCGVGIPTASVSGGTIYNWYNAATSGTLVQTGTSSTYTSAISNTTNYYVSSYNGTCEGTRSMVTASVTIPDAVTASIGSASVCPNTTVSLLATNTGTTNTYSYTWTGSPVVGSGIATSVAGTSVIVTPTLPGNYIYTVAATDGVCNAIATTTLNVFQALTTPPIASGSPNPVCAGSSTVVLSASFGSTVVPTYTTPPSVGAPTTDEDFGNITFGSLNNTSTYNSLSGSIGTAVGTAGDYSDFTAFGPYTYNLGSTYTLSLSSLQGASAYGNGFGVYIDYNKNGVFTDAGEAVYVSTVTTAGAHTETTSITIPSTATPGITRLRVIVNEGLVTGPTMPITWGEYEEYKLNLTPNVTYNWTDGSTSVGTASTLTLSPSTTTTYSFSVTDGHSCSINSAPVTITVNPLPVINATTPSSVVCANSSATLSATGATTYTWAPAGGNAATAVVTPSANTTYTVTGSLLGCISTNTISLATTPSPTLNVVASATSAICAGTTATLTTSGTATSFTWTPAVSTTSMAVVTPTANATYTVVGFDAGCTTTKTISLAVTANPTVNLVATNTVICLGSTTSSTINATGTATSFTWTPAVSTTSTAVVSPTTTASYTVVGLASGCTTTKTITVNVANTPTVTAIAPNNVICAGSTATLTSTGTATSFTWTPVGGNGSSAVVTPTTATTYTLIGSASGCTNSSVVTLTVSALPTVTATSSSSAICTGESAVLTASSSATSYTWSNTANTVSTTVTPTITSNYTVTVSNGTCTANATVSVTVNACIGIEELSSNGISIYPNPTIDKLNIAINADLVSITSVSIYDALGKLVMTEKLNTELTTIRTSNLDSGVYFVKITSNNREIKIGKLVKQ